MKFTIDYETWRCGGEGRNKLGKGVTLLLNSEGYMCCVGQVKLQLGAKRDQIRSRDCPSPVGIPDGILALDGANGCENSELSIAAFRINDNPYTTPAKKMELLKALFAEHGHEIEFVNVPGVV